MGEEEIENSGSEEQQTTEDPGGGTEETVADEASEFSNEDDLDQEDELLGFGREEKTEDKDEASKKKKEGESKDEKKSSKDEAEDKDESGDDDQDEDNDKGDDDAETDEDILRGKEIIGSEEEEQEKADQQDDQQGHDRTVEYNPANDSYNPETIEFLSGVLPHKLLPDTVTLKDGTELDFGNIMEREPELPIMMTAIANNIIKQFVHSGFLASTEGVNNKLFRRSVTNAVPKAMDIFHGEDFKGWFKDQPKEIKALMEKSSDPSDHVRVFQRFLNKTGLEDAKKKVDEIDKKKKEDKKKFDAIQKTTARGKGAKPKGGDDPRAEELEGFNSEEEDDDLFI